MNKRIVSARNLRRKKGVKYVLSYGAGVNSTAMMLFLIENKFPLDYVLFADTGGEMPETYEYVEHVRKYLEKQGIPFQIVRVKNNDTLYDRCMRRKVIPSQTWRWCTRDLKIRPIYAFYRSLKSQVYQYVGIDYDEIHRMKDSKADYVTNIYPLIDYKIGRQECIRLIEKARLPVPVKSGCYFCPFNNLERWSEVYAQHPELFEKAIALEENGKHMPKQKLTPLTLRGLKDAIQNKKALPLIQIESPCGSECMV
jgi:3'-phosphoadenosine 5'-phosphosulfate sulfotransferase (PAPS reductase)/FAD synthetase